MNNINPNIKYKINVLILHWKSWQFGSYNFISQTTAANPNPMYYIYKIQIGERLGLTASSHGRSVKPISLRSYNKANLYP